MLNRRYQTFKIPYLFLSKGDNLQILTNLINSKLSSELVSGEKSVSYVLQNAVNKALNTKRNITQTLKKTH